MPSNWFNNIQDQINQNAPPSSFPNKPQSIEEQINAMPNADKLSPSEKWLYNKLPGVQETSWGKILMGFADSPFGKVLNVLDVGAEAFERTLGLLSQDWNDENFDLKSAWKAGSLFWETAKLPRLSRDENGKITGIHVDTDLPGASALSDARKMLQDGMSIDEVKAKYFENLGALAMRAQLNDTWGHIFGDPAAWALGAVKPIQRLRAIRELAVTGKVDVGYVSKLADAAKLAGNLEDVAKYTKVIEQANATGKAMTRFEKFAIMATGGTPYLQDVTKMSKAQKIIEKITPWKLTPQARASELLDAVASHVGEYIVRPNWHKDPEEAIRMLQSVSRGATGQGWGHAAFTIQGRTVQSFASQADVIGRTLLSEWTSYAKERTVFTSLANIMGTSPRKIIKTITDNPEAFLQKVVEQMQSTGKIDNFIVGEIQGGRLNPQILGQYAKSITNTIPIEKEEFYAKLLVQTQDAAMQQAITQFGVTAKGALTKWADALKAWETIPFIKANPANMVRNLVNNDVTMIGRGLFGGLIPGMTKKFWKEKYVPQQFHRAFGLGVLDEEVDELFDAGNVSKRLTDVLTGEITAADKAKQAAGKVNLGIFDFSKFSQKMEARASLGASTVGWMEFHSKYWNPKTGFTSISKHLPSNVVDKLEAEMPGITSILDDVAQSSGGDPKKFAELMKGNIEHNVSAIFKDASDEIGYDFKDVVGAEVLNMVEDGLSDAIQKGNVKEFMSGIRVQMEKHIDDLFDKNVQELPGIIQAQVQAGGHQQFYRVFSEATDELWGGHTEHAFRMSQLDDSIRAAKSAKDYDKVNAIWTKIMSDSDSHFSRVWKKFDAYQEGLEKGAKAAGIQYSGEIRQSFKDIRKGWDEFFKFRNSEYQKLFDARKAGKDYGKTLDDLQKELDGRFEKMSNLEYEISARIDDVVAESIGEPSLQTSFTNFRDTIAQIKLEDKQNTLEFYRRVRSVSEKDAPALWQQYWNDKMSNMEKIRKAESVGSAMLQGDSEALRSFAGVTEAATDEPFDILKAFNAEKIPTATKTGGRNDIRILRTIKKYTGQEFKSIKEIPEDVARQALEARRLEKGGEAVQQAFIPDAHKIFQSPMPVESALNQLHYGRGNRVIDAIESAAITKGSQKSLKFGSLSPDMQKEITRWMENVGEESNSFRSAAVNYSLFRRDSALLNYNRRTNFDSWLGNVAPFAFWTTHSAFNWIINSADRPAMMATYFRQREFFETAGLQGQNTPQRLRGHIRVNLPFAPEWMGDQFINPTRFALPFDAFMQPWERAAQSKMQIEGKTEKTLETMLDSGEINEQEYQDAIEKQSGQIWDLANGRAIEGGDQYDAMDFVQMTMSPHAPLMWAYNAARGTPQDIGAFTPLSRTSKNVATMLGVEDWNNSPYNVEGRVRKMMGLPAFDKWDDYRIARSISDMAGDGSISADEANEAMTVASLVEAGQMSPEEAKKESKIYADAIKRSNIQSGGWLGGVTAGLFGLPLTAYPEGEQIQRKTGSQFNEVFTKYKDAEKSLDKFLASHSGMEQDDAIQMWQNQNPQLSKDAEGMTKFFEDHPEYETRLALFKSPEERLKTFMIDNMWTRWNELPKLTHDEIREQMGTNFNQNFLDKNTRNYDAVTPQQLQIWLKLIGGKQVGRLEATEEALIELNQLELTEPETAFRVQTFYDRRNTEFDGWYELQNKYYSYPEGSADRKKFVRENPDLKSYWDFRTDWMNRNPDLVKYLTDNQKALDKAQKQQRNPQIAIPTAEEIKSILTPPMQNLLVEYSQGGQTLPPVVMTNLNALASQYNITGEQMLEIVTGTNQTFP